MRAICSGAHNHRLAIIFKERARDCVVERETGFRRRRRVRDTCLRAARVRPAAFLLLTPQQRNSPAAAREIL